MESGCLGMLWHLTSSPDPSKLRPMRMRSVTATLLAWLLIGSGICLCLAAVSVQPTSHSHDCSNEAPVPAHRDDAPCDSGCTAEDAVKTGFEDRTIGQIALGVGAGTVEAASEPTVKLDCLHPGRERRTGRTPIPPAYILHSVLLV